jgi:glycerol-3-phosphate acyltransferase PlsY
MITVIILSLLAYFLGSLSSAVIISKIFKLPDPRLSGSGNPGTTNILRLSGKKYALMVFLGDFIKGVVPILIGKILINSPQLLGIIGLFAILGHIFPLFFHFKGGKGVATSAGVLMALSPLIGLLVLLTWLVIAMLFRYSSLAAIVAAISAPLYGFFVDRHYFFILLIISLVILCKHYVNIKKLMNGTESKIGKSS